MATKIIIEQDWWSTSLIKATFRCYDADYNLITTSNVEEGSVFSIPNGTIWVIASIMNDDANCFWSGPRLLDDEIYRDLDSAISGTVYYDATNADSFTFDGSSYSTSFALGYHKYKVCKSEPETNEPETNEPEITDSKPIYKRVNGEWKKQTAFQMINSEWVKISGNKAYDGPIFLSTAGYNGADTRAYVYLEDVNNSEVLINNTIGNISGLQLSKGHTYKICVWERATDSSGYYSYVIYGGSSSAYEGDILVSTPSTPIQPTQLIPIDGHILLNYSGVIRKLSTKRYCYFTVAQKITHIPSQIIHE